MRNKILTGLTALTLSLTGCPEETKYQEVKPCIERPNINDPHALVGFGDSITAEWSEPDGRYNVSYILNLRDELAPHYSVEEFGLRGTTCPYARDRKLIPEFEATEYREGDIVVLMCFTPNFNITSLEDTVDAVLDMKDIVKETGAKFIFATHGAWKSYYNPDTTIFYNTLFPLLGDTPIIDNDTRWREEGWNLDGDNYSDGVHMSAQGSEKLTDALYEKLCDEEFLPCESNKLYWCGE